MIDAKPFLDDNKHNSRVSDTHDDLSEPWSSKYKLNHEECSMILALTP